MNMMIIIVGILSFEFLTIREYPDVVTPTLSVEVLYPNASPAVVEKDVTETLEESLAGLEGLETITSTSTYGKASVNLTFAPSVRLSDAQSDIRDRLGAISQNLPESAKDPVVKAQAEGSEAFIFMSLKGENYSQADLTHMAKLHLRDIFKTIHGVSSVEVYGADYAMDVMLDRNKMLHFDVDAEMVFTKLSEYHVSLPAGRFEGRIPIDFDMNLVSEDDFRRLPMANFNQKVVTLGDIATVSLGTTRSTITKVDGKDGMIIGLVKSSEGNPLEISKHVHKHFAEYQQTLPADVKLTMAFDRTKFIKGSLSAVQKAIIEAIVLVLLIVFLFLKSGRSTLIPIITIPISLIGVMTFMALFGLSLNTITLLAMVLAVGLVVDDAIVVLENIHRHIENGLSPLEASLKGAKEIGFAIVAMTFTLAAAYAPIAFMQDTIGQVFFEFAVTLAGAVILSGVVALTFSPLMCSKLLTSRTDNHTDNHQESVKKISFMTRLLDYFDHFIEFVTKHYGRALALVLTKPKSVLGGAILVFGGCIYFYVSLPKMITPLEDRGIVGLWMKYIAGTNLDEYETFVDQAETVFRDIPEAPSIITLAGRWGGNVVSALDDWSKRKRSAAEVVQELRKKVQDIPSIEIYPWSWDSGIPGVEAVSSGDNGVAAVLKTTRSYEDLSHYADIIKEKLEANPVFADARHDLKLSYPGFLMDVDRNKLELVGISPEKISKSIAVMMDENLEIEFKKDGVRYPVALISHGNPSFLEEVFVINPDKQHVPLSSFLTLRPTTVPDALNHHNKLRSATLNANTAPGVDMGTAMDVMKQVAREHLPNDVQIEFSGAAKKLKESSVAMLMLILISLVFIYCILAIQFESFIDPLMIMVTVPLAGFGALLMVKVTGGSVNIFTQVGLVTLMGLITKHGILIVEFANQRRAQNLSVQEAIQTAALIRFRPIIMTTAATLFGIIPLIISSGAGAEARSAIGTVLLGGLIVGTILTLFVIPVVYLGINQIRQNRRAYQK